LGGGESRVPWRFRDWSQRSLAAIVSQRHEQVLHDMLLYAQSVLRTKLLESPTLQQQAANNTKEQFAASPGLSTELENAIMDAYDAHTAMSQQALSSETVRRGLLALLLDHAGLYDDLRGRGQERDVG
jgi:type I restriction enzyme, R subunit